MVLLRTSNGKKNKKTWSFSKSPPFRAVRDVHWAKLITQQIYQRRSRYFASYSKGKAEAWNGHKKWTSFGPERLTPRPGEWRWSEWGTDHAAPLPRPPQPLQSPQPGRAHHARHPIPSTFPIDPPHYLYHPINHPKHCNWKVHDWGHKMESSFHLHDSFPLGSENGGFPSGERLRLWRNCAITKVWHLPARRPLGGTIMALRHSPCPQRTRNSFFEEGNFRRAMSERYLLQFWHLDYEIESAMFCDNFGIYSWFSIPFT